MKLVIWDVDGTLVDSHDIITRSLSGGLEDAGLPPMPTDQLLSIVGLSLPVAVATLLPTAAPAQHQAVIDGYRRRYNQDRTRRESPLFPGALALLETLAARDDLLMAVATGKSRRGLDALMESHDLGRFFVAAECADDHPSKPAPGMVLACLAKAGVDAADAVMVGDTRFDMDMAANAGVAAIGVAWGHHSAGELRASGARDVATGFDDLKRLILDWADEQ